MAKTITIFGATGRMSHLLIQQALNKGYRVIGYARNPSKMKITHDRLEIVQGTLDNVTAIEAAIKKADAVIETVGGVSQGTQHIISAMQKAGVRRLIIVSTANASDLKDLPDLKFNSLMAFTRMLLKLIGIFNAQIFNAVRELRKAAEFVRASGLNWTIVRVAILNDKPQSNNVRSGYLGHGIVSVSISRADMAAFLLQQVEDETYLQQAPVISN